MKSNNNLIHTYFLGTLIGFSTAMTFTYVWCYVSLPAGFVSAALLFTLTTFLAYKANKSSKNAGSAVKQIM